MVKYLLIGFLLSIGWQLGDIVVSAIVHYMTKRIHASSWYKNKQNDKNPKTISYRRYRNTEIGFKAEDL